MLEESSKQGPDVRPDCSAADRAFFAEECFESRADDNRSMSVFAAASDAGASWVAES